MNDTPMDGSCPDRQVLAAFVLHLLSPETQRETESHLSTCPACSTLVRELSDEADSRSTSARSTLPFNRTGGARGAFAAEPPGQFVPDRIGQYEILGRLGRGAMGVVCRARHVHLKKPVAIKILPTHRLSDPRMVARFEREMEVVGKLDHPNIVRATDAGSADGIQYLAMELLDGVDLAKVLRACGPLPVADACELVRQAAIGLQHAHENGLVHRDIKPANLMLSSKCQVKVLDLGLALLGDASAEALSASGQFMGTPDYMSPEQFESTRVDIRSDMYSLGCTLFALLSGSPPYPSKGPHDTVYRQMRAHREQPVPPLASPYGELPAALLDVLHRMLEKDPAQRPQNPAEVARDLAPFCTGSDLSAVLARIGKQDTPSEPASFMAETGTQQPTTAIESGSVHFRPRSLRRAGIAALLAVAIVVVAGLAWGKWREHEEVPSAVPGPSAPAARITPGEWCELLDRAPDVVKWPDRPGNSRWDYDPEERTLLLTAEERCMLSVADVEAESYELEATMNQTPWTGGVGVFTRGRQNRPKGQTSVFADSIVLEQIVSPNVLDPAKLFYAEVLQSVTKPSNLLTDVAMPPELVPRPIGAAHRLWMKVGPAGVEEVKWDGKPAPNILQAAARADQRIGAHGKIGVSARNSTTRFTSIRILVQPSNGDKK